MAELILKQAVVNTLNTLKQPVVNTLKQAVVNTVCYDRVILMLQVELGRLEESRFECQRQIDVAERNLEVFNSKVLYWLTEADEILQKGELICEIRAAKSYYFFDIKTRFKLGRSAKKLIEEIDQLGKHDFETMYLPTGRRISNWSSTNEVVEFKDVVLKVLKNDDQNSIVGLYGVVGNSERVAIQVCKIAKEEKIFDDVVMVNIVSTHPNLYKIQCDLEKKLGLKFEEGKSLLERGEIVEEGLLNRRVLVVLYNVKKKFELRDVGIQSEYPWSKVVVISSELGICEEMGIQRIFQVPNVIQDNDAWDHFKRMSGDWLQKAGRDCIANEFLNQYCGGYSKELEFVDLKKLAEEMDKWIQKIEESNGINVREAINKRRMNLFGGATQRAREESNGINVPEAINMRRMNLFAGATRRARVGFLRLC